MKESFKNADGYLILAKMVSAIQENKVYLGDIDGQIGDGDHGMNMNKGFSIFGNRINGKQIAFSDGLIELGNILLTEIGGSMGPIYGTIFITMGTSLDGLELIDKNEFTNALKTAENELFELIDARVGDKTLVDVLSPAIECMNSSSCGFADSLELLCKAAEEGMNSTKEMVAKYGRSSRLGERSRGVLDAGSVSCCIILQAMSDGICNLLEDAE